MTNSAVRAYKSAEGKVVDTDITHMTMWLHRWRHLPRLTYRYLEG